MGVLGLWNFLSCALSISNATALCSYHYDDDDDYDDEELPIRNQLASGGGGLGPVSGLPPLLRPGWNIPCNNILNISLTRLEYSIACGLNILHIPCLLIFLTRPQYSLTP